jgi:hypothetical protein
MKGLSYLLDGVVVGKGFALPHIAAGQSPQRRNRVGHAGASAQRAQENAGTALAPGAGREPARRREGRQAGTAQREQPIRPARACCSPASRACNRKIQPRRAGRHRVTSRRRKNAKRSKAEEEPRAFQVICRVCGPGCAKIHGREGSVPTRWQTGKGGEPAGSGAGLSPAGRRRPSSQCAPIADRSPPENPTDRFPHAGRQPEPAFLPHLPGSPVWRIAAGHRGVRVAAWPAGTASASASPGGSSLPPVFGGRRTRASSKLSSTTSFSQ